MLVDDSDRWFPHFIGAQTLNYEVPMSISRGGKHVQGQTGMELGTDQIMLNPLPLSHVDDSFHVLGDLGSIDGIVVHLDQTRWTGRVSFQLSSMLKVEKLDELGFGRLLGRDDTEVDDAAGMAVKDDLASNLGFFDADWSQRMRNAW